MQLRQVFFRVGGVPITLTGTNHPLLPETIPEYLPFLERAAAGAGIRVELEVAEPTAAAAEERMLLEAGGSWTLRERSGNFVITPRSAREGGPPPWEAEIDRERWTVRVSCGNELLVERDGTRCIWSPFHYPLDQVVLMLALIGRGAIVHAAAVDINGKALILAGTSRAGKTTISRLCDSAGITVLSDDRVIVRRVDGEFRVFGTPWPGEGGFAENLSLPLAAVVFLAKGDADRLEAIPPGDAMRRLLPVVSLPLFDGELAGKALDFCMTLISCSPAYQLTFRPDSSAVRTLQEACR